LKLDRIAIDALKRTPSWDLRMMSGLHSLQTTYDLRNSCQLSGYMHKSLAKTYPCTGGWSLQTAWWKSWSDSPFSAMIISLLTTAQWKAERCRNRAAGSSFPNSKGSVQAVHVISFYSATYIGAAVSDLWRSKHRPHLKPFPRHASATPNGTHVCMVFEVLGENL
jgi:hypothetical protein